MTTKKLSTGNWSTAKHFKLSVHCTLKLPWEMTLCVMAQWRGVTVIPAVAAMPQTRTQGGRKPP